MVDNKEMQISELLLEFSGKLSEEILLSIKELNSSNEWGVALEELCNMLYEYNINLELKQYQAIERLGLEMEINKENLFF
jgi:hypothetical protein